LINCSVLNQTLLYISDQLALSDACCHFVLRYLVEQFETGHGILLFEFKQEQQSLVLHKTIFAAVYFVLEFTDRLFDDLRTVAAPLVQLNHTDQRCRNNMVGLVV